MTTKLPEIRVENSYSGRVHKVWLVREDEDDVDLTELFYILGVRRDIRVGELPRVTLEVLGRLVEIEAT